MLRLRWALISLPVIVIILACAGGDWDPDDVNYSFFAPEVSQASDPEFFHTWHYLYQNNDFDPADQFLKRNVEEWYGWFREKLTYKDIEQFLYHSPVSKLDSLLRVSKGKKQLKNFLLYLRFAKQSEDYFKRLDYWYYDEKKQTIDTIARERLIKEGMKLYAKQKDAFVKERYLFQLIRLNYNAGKYAACLALNQRESKHLLSESMVIRSAGYVAASFYKLQKYAEANYRYATIYLYSDLMDIVAIQSFHPMDEIDWVQCLKLAQKPEEKATLWYMLGIYSEDNLRAMKEIAIIQPGSPYLDLLLSRAINISENTCLPATGSFERADHTQITVSIREDALLKFCQEQIKTGAVKNKAYWQMACGYIQTLQSRYFDAAASFQLAEEWGAKDPLLLDQIRLFRFVNFLNTTVPSKEELNTSVLDELKWLNENKDPLRKNDAWRWAVRQLGHLFLTVHKDTLMSHLINGALDYQYSEPIGFYNRMENRKKMVALMDKEDKTPFETFFLDKYIVKRGDICELNAIEEMYRGNLKAALKIFNDCYGDGGKLNGDPFIIHIRDCHDCDHAAPQTITYTKKSFIEKMISLEQKAKKEPKKAPEYYFEMANGFYNMTYFGNGRAIYYCLLNTSGYHGDYHDSEKKDLINEMDCSRAELYYKKAAALSKDKEFKAKCYFMAAKCEMNKFYTDLTWNSEEAPEVINNFEILKDSLSNTQYYREIIRECSYFAGYIQPK